MNHVYRSLWSQALNTWIAVAETCKGNSKNTCKNNRLITQNSLKDWQSCVFATGLLLCALDVRALPTGDQLVAGQATVHSPNAGQMQINQTSPQAIINWQGFSIAPNERVMINQPSINAALLNRVIGADASLIQGQLSAQGQVFLINPNGVLFSNTAQVDVGSLIASTHSISNVDFLNGNYHFTQNSNEGLLINQGVIKVPEGGVVALIGSQVSNQGTIESPKGTTALAAGKTVDLDFQGDGLLAVSVSEAALNAHLENKGAILADGGRVVLTAKAAGDLVGTVLNSEGVIQAKSLVERNGEIILDGGDKGVTQISGKLDVSGQQAGGKINVTGKDVTLAANANLVAQALESGKAGTIFVLGDMKNGVVNVAGTLDASAPKKGDGGFIETSAAQVNVANSVKVSTQAVQGKTGGWLIDPTDFIISNGTAYSNNLDTTDVTISITANDNLVIDADITKTAGTSTTLTLNAINNITLKSGRSISSTSISSPLNVVFKADSDASGQGAILTETSSSINSKGGNITLGGGNGSISAGVGFARGYDATRYSGVTINGSLNAAGGHIIANGISDLATAGLGHDIYGVTIGSTGNISTTGSGTIRLTGESMHSNVNVWSTMGVNISGNVSSENGDTFVVGTAGNNNSAMGVVIDGTSALLQATGTGNITVNGTVGNSAVSTNSTRAVLVQNGGIVRTNSGNLSLNGVNTSTSTSAVESIGVNLRSWLNNVTVESTSGAISLTGQTVASGGKGIAVDWTTNTQTIGGNTSGDILLNAKNGSGMDLTNANIKGTGTITLNAEGGGNITQTNGFLQAANLRILGDTTASAVTLNYSSNNVSNIAANLPITDSSLSYTNGTAPLAVNNITSVAVANSAATTTNGITVNGNFTLNNPNATTTAPGIVDVKGIFTLASGTWNQFGSILPNFFAQDFRISSGSTFIRATDNILPYRIIDIYGLQGVGSAGMLGATYKLGADIDASSTSTWNGGAGFVPIGTSGSGNQFTGSFDGLGFTVLGLNINRPTTDNVGLFGYTGFGGGISNIGLVGGSVIGNNYVGGLVGNNAGNISNSYATSTATGIYSVGGLVGINTGVISNVYATGNVIGNRLVGGLVGAANSTIDNAYATGNVSGSTYSVGGLVGYSNSTIKNSYATGNVSGDYDIGGLMGTNAGNISDTYATGNVSGTYDIGGLVGNNFGNISNTYATGVISRTSGVATSIGGLLGTNTATVTNSFWDTQTTGQSASAGGTGKTTAEMKQLATFTVASWDISDTGSDGKIWRIYEGNTAPLLRSFLTSLTVTSDSVSRPYNGLVETALTNPSFSVTPTANLLGTAAPYSTAKNVGVYNAAGLYSNQQGFDITQTSGLLTITPYSLNLTGTRGYDGTANVAATALTVGTLPQSETLVLGGTGTVADKNVGTDKLVSGTFTLANGTGLASNYTFTGGTQKVSITPAALTINAVTDTKTYDGTTTSTQIPTFSGLQTGDTLTGLSQAFANPNVLGTNASTLQVNSGYTLTDGNTGGNYTVITNTALGTISAAALNAINLKGSRPYDGTANVAASIFSLSGLLNNDNLTLSGVGTIASKNVGAYNSINLGTLALGNGTIGLASNYTLVGGTQIVTITPAALTINAVTDAKIYDGTTTSTQIPTFSGLQTGDTLSGLSQAFTSPNVLGANASTLQVNNGYTLSDGNTGGNYTVITNSALGTISAAALNAINLSGSRTYDGTTNVAANIFTLSGLLNNDNLTLSGVGTIASKNVGTYNGINLGTLALGNGTIGLASNYTLTGGTQTVNITPATLAINAVTDNKVYDGTTTSAQIPTVSGLQTGDTLTKLSQSFVHKNVSGLNASTLNANGGYNLNDGNAGGNYAVQLGSTFGTITPATLTLNAVTDAKTYDGTTTSTQIPTFTGLQTGDALTGLSQTFTNPNVLGANASSLTVNNSYTLNDGNAGGNYTVITNNALGTISAAALNAINLSGSRTYDGTTNIAASIFSLSGLLNNDDLTLSGVATIASKNVGTYNSINLDTLALGNGTIGLATNYTLIGGTHSVTITPAVLSLNAVTDSKVYDGSTHSAVVPSFSGLQSGDTLANLSQAFTNKNVLGVNGSTLTVNSNYTLNDGNAGSNYTVSSSTAVGTIAPATLTYTALPSQRVYGDSNPVFTGTVTGFANGETLANATTGSANFTSVTSNTSNVNSYAIEGAGLTANFGNYSFTQAASNAIALSIIPATLVYTAIPVSNTNGASPVFSGIVTGFVNNDSLASATVGSPVFTSEVNHSGNNKKAGSFAINGSGLSAKNGNYQFVQAASNATALIIPAPVAEKNAGLQEQITQLEAKTASEPNSVVDTPPVWQESNQSDTHALVLDQTDNFAGYSSENLPSNLLDFPCVSGKDNCNSAVILPTLKIKNSAGRVERLQLTANKRFLSLLLEDGTVRVWDFDSGVQRNILSANQTLTDISTVNDKGEFLAVSSHSGVGVHEVVSAIADNEQAIHKPDIHHLTTSEDGKLLLISAGSGELSLWDNQQNKPHWQRPYQRGVVAGLALNNNNQYGAVLSHHPRTYALPVSLKLKNITDAIDIINLNTGKISKVLPNVGEQVVTMQFKDSNTLQVGLGNGEIFDWSITTGTKKRVAAFAENITTVDIAGDNYAYILSNGTVRVSDSKGHIQLSTQNKDNPFKFAKLLAGGKKLLTVLASGDLSLWDVASGKKMLRLFSTKQGWTVMDAFGRFDGSEEAIEDFSWLAKEDDIPLDSFSENYYEPGLLASVLREQHYLNGQQRAIKDGITLPPKVNLQLAEQQTETDKVALQLDVYDRGGGINKINFYHNGKLLGNEQALVTQETADHRVLALNIIPNAGKNTLKVTVSNQLGIENSSSELSFDGKTKAYASTLRLLTVGIDRYSDAKLNLDYSVADANAITQVLKKNAKVAMNKSLTNEKATKARILAELKELSRGEQHDVLAVYLAGHGMVLGKEWYFLPFETKLHNDFEKIAASGITATELSEVFKNSKIQHILLMADSCHSGASVDAFSQLQNGQRYFTRQLSRSLGITVVTATTKDQEATELQSLGHGLFTYLMTQELAKNQNGSAVTAHSIAASIAKTLPAFSKKVLGISQDPAVYTHGNDFMLTEGVKKANKDKVSAVITPIKLEP
jgi:filamentous hemagglutinin family protein